MTLKLTGFVEVSVTREDETELETIEGRAFGFEEGDDDVQVDPDDGSRSMNRLYIAFCEGYSLLVQVGWNGYECSQGAIEVRMDAPGVTATVESDDLVVTFQG